MRVWVNGAGYRELRIEGRVVKEHRVVMERVLGRRLSQNEVVHHINGDRVDNRPENLQVMSRAEHGKLHGVDHLAAVQHKGTEALVARNTGRPAWNSGTAGYVQLICPFCSQQFRRLAREHTKNQKRGHGSHCSRSCASKAFQAKAKGEA